MSEGLKVKLGSHDIMFSKYAYIESHNDIYIYIHVRRLI